MRTGVEPKPAWRSIPVAIRNAVSETLGAKVATGRRVWGGYGPSPTFRLTLADGRRAFVKGCAPDASEFMRAAFARELRAYADLRDQIRDWTPTVFGTLARDGWELLILEDLGPKSVPPWPPRKTRAIIRAFARFHAINKEKPLPNWLKRPSDWLGEDLSWAWTTSRECASERASVAGSMVAQATDWFVENGALLGSTSRRMLTVDTPQLLHNDARSDNLRWQNKKLYLVDWAEAVAGPPEFDAAAFIQTIAVESTFDPETILRWYVEVNPLDPAMLDAAVVAIAGFFAERAWRPELPGLPRLRAFQKQQLAVTLKWAVRRLAIEAPSWLDAIPVA